MEKFLINGNFLCRNLSGIERFAIEVTKKLDAICDKGTVYLLSPCNAKTTLQLANIKVLFSRHKCTIFPIWDNIIFALAAKKQKAIALDFSNTMSLLQPGVAFLHDIYFKLFPKDFSSLHDKLIAIYSLFMYRAIAKHSIRICTVSNAAKAQITSAYRVNPNKIAVVSNGWDHFRDIEPCDSILETFSLKKGQYYFTLGSLSKRKNLKWIARAACYNPQSLFVISGQEISGLLPKELEQMHKLDNVIFTGRISDNQVKSLMTNSKAFIFPSYYEGFGIPPLEALSCGCRIVVSNIPCLKEIYKDAAIYIDCNNADINLDALIKTPVSSGKELLDYYTYEHSAQALYALLKSL